MLAKADKARRRQVPASNLLLGLECGGSDGYSGITANPALGAAADLVVRNGGTVILSETPEIYGAEHLLLARAANPRVGQKLLDKIDWWREYVTRNQGEMNNNPSPGNKVGGLTTILEKSLGAVAKAGSTDLMEVYDFAEPVTAKGMVFMDTPGYDLISITGMIAGGANMICFTTGRGSVLGSKPAPTIKLASNTQIYRRLIDDMDIDCGLIVDGTATVKEMGQAIFDTILQTASGRKTKSEVMDLGDCEFVPWPLGAIM
jgi:altronate hydrolase